MLYSVHVDAPMYVPCTYKKSNSYFISVPKKCCVVTSDIVPVLLPTPFNHFYDSIQVLRLRLVVHKISVLKSGTKKSDTSKNLQITPLYNKICRSTIKFQEFLSVSNFFVPDFTRVNERIFLARGPPGPDFRQPAA